MAGLLAACSPALNWREVQIGRLNALLPCKPDTASRPVALAGQTLNMDMVGCEAGGALYAISRVQAPDESGVSALLAALREDALAHIAQSVVRPLPNTGDAQSSLDLLVDGQRANGAPLQARFKWWLVGREVYQIAVYAEHLGPEITDSLTTEARIR